MDSDKLTEIIRANNFSNYCGLDIIQQADGSFLVQGRVEPEYTNQYGTIHGGYLYTIADLTAGYNSLCYLESPVTLDSNVHFIRNVKSGIVTGRAEVIKGGRKIVMLRVSVTDEKGILLLEGSFTYYNMAK